MKEQIKNIQQVYPMKKTLSRNAYVAAKSSAASTAKTINFNHFLLKRYLFLVLYTWLFLIFATYPFTAIQSQCGIGKVESFQKISDTEGNFTATLDNSDSFGESVTSIGDINGDGVNDLAVGARGDDDGGVGRGAVYILLMKNDGTVSSFQKISDTEGSFTATLDNSDFFGSSVTSIGDINGDGVNDLAVGALDDDGGSNRGAVYILLMNNDGTVSSFQKISDTEGSFTATLDNFDAFGRSVTSIGDINGDGVNDLAVGADSDDDGSNNNFADRGAVYILLMKNDGTVNNFQKISDTEGNFTATLDNFDSFGESVTNIGDINGDGVNDLAVGADGDDDGGSNRGAVYILLMKNDGTMNSFQKISDTEGNFTATLEDSDQFGESVTNIGDINGDGINDLAVGAREDDDGGGNRGAVYILLMKNDGTVNSFQKISDTEGNFTATLEDFDRFGQSVTSIGDINGDGVNDLAVGATGDTDGGEGRGAVYILNLCPIILSISKNADGAEDNTNGSFTISTTQQFTNATTVNITIAGTATNGTDYANIPTTFSFPANTNTATINVDVTADALVEGAETVIVTLAAGTGYSVGAAPNNTATVTISDNEFPSLSIAATTQASEDATDGQFTITTSDQFSTATTINVTISGTATNGRDYTTIPTTFTFPANTSTATIDVEVITDAIGEGPETVIVTLVENGSSFSAATTTYTVGSPSSATVTITDNDVMYTIKSGNELMFGDPCSCDDPRNCEVAGVTFFHDTLTVTAGGVSGLTITAAAGATDFYTAVPCFSGTLTLIPTGIVIPESPAGSGEYKIEFWRPSGATPTLSVVESGNTTAVPAATFQPVCTMEACTPSAPIPTMSQWGLVIFGLLVMNLGVFFVQRRGLVY